MKNARHRLVVLRSVVLFLAAWSLAPLAMGDLIRRSSPADPASREPDHSQAPEAVAEALDAERRRRRGSLKQTVIELLSQGLGVGTTRSNGLGRFAGTWSEEELREFQKAVRGLDPIDDERWAPRAGVQASARRVGVSGSPARTRKAS